MNKEEFEVLVGKIKAFADTLTEEEKAHCSFIDFFGNKVEFTPCRQFEDVDHFTKMFTQYYSANNSYCDVPLTNSRTIIFNLNGITIRHFYNQEGETNE